MYKDKLILSNLAENIEFKEAKTIEDAIKFSKETLGIKNVDNRFTLEALNIANKGLVEVSNANKGKMFMPQTLRFESPKKETNEYIAYVVRSIESKEFGDLVINKNYFDNSFLDKELKEHLYTQEGKKFFDFNAKSEVSSTRYFTDGEFVFLDNDLAQLTKRFYDNPNSVSITDKQKIFYSFLEGCNKSGRKYRSPIEALKKLKETDAEFLKNNNISINIEELSNKTTAEQKRFLMAINKKMFEQKHYKNVVYNIESPTSTIHHEMGHLQDFAENLKTLDLKQCELGSKDYWKNLWKKAKENAKNKKKIENRNSIEEVDNRWGTITRGDYKKLLDDAPEKFKKRYPDLYEFLKNQEIQQTAGKISGYAQVGIGEFIAETYAKMIAKEQLPEDVIALYKKYNGPKITS